MRLAKDKPLVSIVLYSSASGPAWVQLTDFLLNGKREVYACTGESLDGNAYRKLPKMALTAGMMLEREAGGVLVLVGSSGRSCVLPANLKLEKKQTYALKDLVDTAQLGGKRFTRRVRTIHDRAPRPLGDEDDDGEVGPGRLRAQGHWP